MMNQKDVIEDMVKKINSKDLNKEAEEFIDYIEENNSLKRFLSGYYDKHSTNKIIGIYDRRFPYFVTGEKNELELKVHRHIKRNKNIDKSTLIGYETVNPVFIYLTRGHGVFLDGKNMKYHNYMVELGYTYDSKRKTQLLHFGTQVLSLTKKNLFKCLNDHCIQPALYEERNM